MSAVKPIQTEADCDAALEKVAALMDDLSGPDSQIDAENHPSRIELDALVALIETYEAVYYLVEEPTPVGFTD